MQWIDKRWERIKIAYDLLVNGQGTPSKKCHCDH
jgi:bisphosphoglycerate-independent phosphoglycerate mutase (AlkP superfamily)